MFFSEGPLQMLSLYAQNCETFCVNTKDNPLIFYFKLSIIVKRFI